MTSVVAARRSPYPSGMTSTAAPERDIVSWDDLDRLVAGLARQLAGAPFDVMLAITRGGLVPAGMLAYRLRIRNILVAAVEYYDDHGAARPAPDVPPVPGRSAAARPAGPRRRRGLGQRHDDPRGDRAGPPGRRHPDDRGAPLQARTLEGARVDRTSTRSRPTPGWSIRSRPVADGGSTMTRTQLLVGTKKGAFILESDADRRDWSVRGPLCEGWPIHDLIVEPGSGAILAAGGSPWFGPAVWRSEDGGETWTHSSAGLTYGDDGPSRSRPSGAWRRPPTARSWPASNPPGSSGAPTAARPGRHVEGLTNHPTRPTWQPGAGGLILHTIVPHPTDPARTWVGISAVGVFETRDGGASWEPRNVGVRADFMPEPVPDHRPVRPQVRRWPPASPSTLYQQNHCGVYRSDDGGGDVAGADRQRAADRVRLPDGRPPARPGHRSGSSRSTAPNRAASCPTASPPSGGRTIGAPRGSAPTTGLPDARRVPDGAARGDGARHARPGRDHVRDRDRPAVAQRRRGPVVADDHRQRCPRSGPSRPSSSTD